MGRETPHGSLTAPGARFCFASGLEVTLFSFASYVAVGGGEALDLWGPLGFSIHRLRSGRRSKLWKRSERFGSRGEGGA